MTIGKKILVALGGIAMALQFIQPTVENTEHSGFTDTLADKELAVVLEAACFDCHSNQTTMPWYTHIQPVGWWIAHHVDEGRRELNFDTYSNYSPRKKYHKLEETRELIEAGEMPLKSYTIIHKEARLNEKSKQLILDWVNDERQALERIYPKDSLVFKRKPA